MILEAETVTFSDTNQSIYGKYFLAPYDTPRNDCCRPEFWRIRSLVEDTTVGPRREVRKRHRRCEFPVWKFIPNLTTKLVYVFLSSYYFLRSEVSYGVTRCGMETRMEEDPTWTGVAIHSSAQLDWHPRNGEGERTSTKPSDAPRGMSTYKRSLRRHQVLDLLRMRLEGVACWKPIAPRHP
jgi:hypothetical protein